MKPFIKYSFLFLGISLFAACQKKDNTTPDPSKVTINVTSPMTGIIFHTGDTINVSADFSYISEMHGVAVTITDSATGEELFEADQDLHTDHFPWAQSWVDTCTQPTTLIIKYIAFITDTGEEGNKTITVYSKP